MRGFSVMKQNTEQLKKIEEAKKEFEEMVSGWGLEPHRLGMCLGFIESVLTKTTSDEIKREEIRSVFIGLKSFFKDKADFVALARTYGGNGEEIYDESLVLESLYDKMLECADYLTQQSLDKGETQSKEGGE